MKVPVRDIIVKYLKHGDVPYTAVSDDSGSEVRLYCPYCEEEAHEQCKHPASPYPLPGTSPSVIEACGRGD